ncbi:intermediate cleaving peptidase 55, mitochondrial-like [Magnolia sinica]|uniref:intermediate cleaving peptidase 55, mitochondrial-like n=2 Tax=Magnolia sinica TaxID=86752 RepID=UPI00265B21C7|nr:intermediate cleaving peptidase 55, mitochondrial-like [Magnolia sinica]
MSTFDMKDESKEVIWQGEIGGVYAALDTFKAEKAFPMCKLTRLLRDSLGGRTKTCIIDVGSGRNANTGKDNGVNQSTDRGLTSTSSPVSQDIENKATIPTMRNGDDSWSLETSSGGLVNALLEAEFRKESAAKDFAIRPGLSCTAPGTYKEREEREKREAGSWNVRGRAEKPWVAVLALKKEEIST